MQSISRTDAAVVATPPLLPRCWPGWAVTFVTGLLLYALTATPYIQWQDFGHFVLRVVQGEPLNPLGLALVHPLHYWLSRGSLWLLPVEPPQAVALVSALFGAVTVANVFGIVKTATGRDLPAGLAAAGLAIAHTFWHLSTMPETRTLSGALLTAEIWAVLRWDLTRRPQWLVLMFAANGLALANHNLALLTLPILGMVLLWAMWRREVGIAALAAAAGAWLIGSSPYTLLVVQQAVTSGDVSGTIHSALFGIAYREAVLGLGLFTIATVASMMFTVLSFPNLMLPAAVLGAIRARRAGLKPLTHRVLLVALAIHLLFVLRYDVVDQYAFLLPAYTLAAVLAGIGAAVALAYWPAWWRRVTVMLMAVTIALTPVWYLFAPEAARRMQVLAAVERHKPYRDDYHHLLVPWGRAKQSAHLMTMHATQLAGQRGLLIVEDGMAAWAVQYQVLRQQRPNVELAREHDAAQIRQAILEERPVVLVPQRTDRPPPPPPHGQWRRVGDLYVLE